MALKSEETEGRSGAQDIPCKWEEGSGQKRSATQKSGKPWAVKKQSADRKCYLEHVKNGFIGQA